MPEMSFLDYLFSEKAKIIPHMIGSIFGGILVAVLTALYFKFRRQVRKWWFKRVFGQDADKDGNYFIVYAKLFPPSVLDEAGNPVLRPFTKPARTPVLFRSEFSIENPVSSCELRAAKYLSAAFGSLVQGQPILTSDMDIELSESPLDRSFISLGGGLSNWKTDDVLNNESNKLVRILPDGFISVDPERLVLRMNSRFDYGLILRIRPNEFPDRVWIVCAGLGEWGTSGAAWYLAKRWRKLLRANYSWSNPLYFGKGINFATIVRVKSGQDESAKPVAHFKSPEDVLSWQLSHTGPTTQTSEPYTTSAPSSPSASAAYQEDLGTPTLSSVSATPDDFEDNAD